MTSRSDMMMRAAPRSIAVLSNTFQAVEGESILQSRTSFATGILKLELLAESFGMSTRVGKLVGDAYVFEFRSVQKNSEGGGTGGSADPFEVPDEGGALARIERKLEELMRGSTDDAEPTDEVPQYTLSRAPQLPMQAPLVV